MMRKTTNEFQENYMVSKALVEVMKSKEREMEHKYIIDNKIVGKDGLPLKAIFCIGDEAAFDIANEELSAIVVLSGLEEELNYAKAALVVAENALIAYALSIAPSSSCDALADHAKHNYSTRMKIIDLALRLDASTVRTQEV